MYTCIPVSFSVCEPKNAVMHSLSHVHVLYIKLAEDETLQANSLLWDKPNDHVLLIAQYPTCDHDLHSTLVFFLGCTCEALIFSIVSFLSQQLCIRERRVDIVGMAKLMHLQMES